MVPAAGQRFPEVTVSPPEHLGGNANGLCKDLKARAVCVVTQHHSPVRHPTDTHTALSAATR